MEYKYLAEFARESKVSGLFFRKVLRWRDQYAIIFNGKSFLQVNLLSNDPFCFFSERELIDWAEAGELAMMQQHLKRARLENLNIVPGERIITLDFMQPDPFRQQQRYQLILELIPQFGNIILTRSEEEKRIIIDCARKITLAENHQRQLIPAAEYEYPPGGYINEESRINYPLGFDQNMTICEAADNGWKNIGSYLEARYYEGWLKHLSLQNLQREKARIQKEKKKKEKKLKKQEKEFAESEREDNWLQAGELLKSAQQQIKAGMKSIKLVNYFDVDLKPLEIELVPDKPVQWNINRYFKKYRKAKNGKTRIAEQIELTKKEISDLDNELEELKQIDILLPGQKIQVVTGKNSITKNITRISVNSDWEFLVGRNSKENDFLTTRIAKPEDWWFHTRIYKGTHVVLRNLKKQDIPESLLSIGCRLAAYYSKAGKSENVPVDYTQIRYVRKPRGSAPGYVIYTHQKTLYVNPLSIRQAREKVAEWHK